MKWLLTLAVGSASCTAVADFPAERLVESTDALCSDGIDDDDDGLTDCQDWKCLDRAVCCTVPSVVLEDAFEGTACAADPCAGEDRACAPDPDRWDRWGAPLPYLCEGAFAVGKDFAGCYPVGMLSRATVRLAPGLRVEGRISGVPEQAGRLDLALTLQDAVIDGEAPCLELAPVPTLAGFIYAAAADGDVRFLATVGDTPIAEVIRPPGEFRVTIEVTQARTLQFLVDGVAMATTTDPLPADLDLDAHVVTSGLGMTARLEHLRVVTGTRCDAPAGWVASTPATPLDPPPEGGWDEFQRRAPNATLSADGRVHLRYAGCRRAASATCDDFTLAIGEATASSGSAFERSEELPLLADLMLPIGDRLIPDAHILEAEGTAYYGADGSGLTELLRCDVRGDDAEILASRETVLAEATTGWDAGAVCCPSVVDRPGDDVRRIYYAGHGDGDSSWHIGLATSRDGGAFGREPAPVLAPGPEDTFDELGVSQPWVLWDDARQMFRMWYTATGAFGITSIGYAVSTDGTVWHKFEAPVVERALLEPELTAIGSPTVVDDGGRLRMWIDGLAPGAVARTIYELENLGGDPP